MEDAPGEGFPDPSPALPPGTGEELFQQAEEARRRQVWEEAIRLYRYAVQKLPNNIDARRGLALSYEAKGREAGYESYLSAAMAEYRKMISLEPSSTKAHDALLAAAAKQDLLGEVLEEYQARIAKGGCAADLEALRKIQALLLMKASPVKKGLPPPSPLISFLFGLVAPGLAVIALGAALLLKFKSGASHEAGVIAQALIKLSMGGFFSFASYKVFLYWRASR